MLRNRFSGSLVTPSCLFQHIGDRVDRDGATKLLLASLGNQCSRPVGSTQIIRTGLLLQHTVHRSFDSVTKFAGSASQPFGAMKCINSLRVKVLEPVTDNAHVTEQQVSNLVSAVAFLGVEQDIQAPLRKVEFGALTALLKCGVLFVCDGQF